MKQFALLVGLLVVAALSLPTGMTTAAEVVQHGYTIPLVDLAAQTERQTVVDREPGQYLGHPTTVLLEDGRTMIAVYPKGHGRGAIVMKRSTDGGRTWSERLPTPASWATSQEVPTIYRVVDAKGTRRLIMFSGLYPIRMSVSENDGQTWSELKPIGSFGGIVAMASLIPLHIGPGHYMALFHDDGRFIGREPAKSPKGFRVYKTVSMDGGLTWGLPDVIAMHPQAHLCEPGTVRSSVRHRGFDAVAEIGPVAFGSRHPDIEGPSGRTMIGQAFTSRSVAALVGLAGLLPGPLPHVGRGARLSGAVQEFPRPR